MSVSARTIYLDDHLALMTGELELLERVQGENSGSALGESVKQFVGEVTRQQDRVRQVLRAAGGNSNSIKQAAAWLGEKIGRLKPNGGFSGYTDLARVIELETLMSLAFARILMWSVVRRTEALQLSLSPSELATFEEQSQAQLEKLQEHHRIAMDAAFGEQTAKR